MNNTDLIKELRALTQAGMRDCKESLQEAGWDLQKAVDIVKKKGLNVVSGREGKVATEGAVKIAFEGNQLAAMMEINCQTDFVAKNDDFLRFVDLGVCQLARLTANDEIFTVDALEDERKQLVSSIKENVVVRRWWVEQAFDPAARVFSYVHSNMKVGVLITLQAATSAVADNPSFINLGNDLAMQVAAMNPLAISVDHLLPADLTRQRAIFEAQLVELNKPQIAWPKILDGKLNKWYGEVCLLNQESILNQDSKNPKTTVAQVLKNVSTQLGEEIQVINFIRCQVGEGLEKETSNFVDEISRMSGV